MLRPANREGAAGVELYMIVFIQVILVIVILGAMTMILLGLDHLINGGFDITPDDTEKLRDEVNTRREVIGRNNVFNSLVSEDDREAAEATSAGTKQRGPGFLRQKQC